MMVGMSCQITTVSHEPLSSKGQAPIDRWEGLKEWHRRHQELLHNRVNSANFHDYITQGETDSIDAVRKSQIGTQSISTPQVCEIQSLKHDLSVISEGEEDSRFRDDDKDVTQTPSNIPKLDLVSLSTKNKPEKTSLLLSEPMEKHRTSVNSKSLNTQEKSSENIKVVRRPFLRKGQGLARYNLNPEEVMHPYRKHSVKKTKNLDNKIITSSRLSRTVKDHCPSTSNNYPQLKQKPQRFSNLSSVLSLSAPMERLVLTAPSDSCQHSAVGTWSQVLRADGRPSPISTERSKHGESNTETSKKEVFSSVKDKIVQSSLSNGDDKQKNHSSVDDEQESLAAYVDLEQHVGNASFCSTSSKVDRLVAKSYQTSIHPSNPDAITQSKPQSPPKTSKGFAVRECTSGASFRNNSVWTTQSDLEDLLRYPNWYSASSGGDARRVTSCTVAVDENSTFAKSEDSSVFPHGDEYPTKETPFELHTNDIGSLLNQLGQARKPHLMKTMPSIDLDSSLVKNGLAPCSSDADRFREFDAGSDSSCSSSETDSDSSSVSGSSISNKSHASVNANVNSPLCVAVCNASKESNTPHFPIDPATVEGINKQIESHLEELRKEIKSLQDAKSKSQKYVSSLEKKVLELEHRLVIEARSFSKRLDEEKQSAEKKLLDEQTKFQKEKQVLQKTIREQRKHLADPVTQQELIRLKQEVLQWEEKWRTDRAKARGQESNLRIQITNLKKENEKLKDENNKIRRERETAINAVRAKAVTNTRVINNIAQQLGKNKPKMSAPQQGTLAQDSIKQSHQKTCTSSAQNSAYNLSHTSSGKHPVVNCITTIGTFPKPSNPVDEWASEDETDLGKEKLEEEDSMIDTRGEKSQTEINEQLPETADVVDAIGLHENSEIIRNSPVRLTDSIIEDTQAKYDALFGNNALDISSPQGNFKAPCKESASVYHPINDGESKQSDDYIKTVHHSDGKIEQMKKSGTRVITHPDGTWERHSPSGSIMIVPACGWPVQISYFNGDRLEKLEDGTVRYFYAKNNTWQTTFPDGREELLYPSGQVEHRAKDGSTKITFPVSCDSNVTYNKKEECVSPLGICVEKDVNGDTVILLPNGERELHTKDYMRKDFLDGSVKFVFKDGSQETRYPSGRIRLKDSQGNLIKDTGMLHHQ